MSLRSRRATAQLLHRPGRAKPLALVRHLLAVQAQDLRAARLALRACAAGLRFDDVDTALEARELVVSWLGRGTLHLVAAEDYPWLLALTAPGRLAHNRRRLGQEGVSPGEADRAVAVIEAALAEEGPLTRAALAELARRYLAGHGPASAADLATWAGLPLRDARTGLGAINSELADQGAARDAGLFDLADRPAPREAIPARLLPAFDPYLLGWKDRAFAVAQRHAKRVHPGGGMLRATATVDGLAVGTWTLPGGEVKLDLFTRVSRGDAAALEAEAAEVAAFVATSARPS